MCHWVWDRRCGFDKTELQRCIPGNDWTRHVRGNVLEVEGRAWSPRSSGLTQMWDAWRSMFMQSLPRRSVLSWQYLKQLFRRARENVVRRTALYLQMDGGRYCNLLHLTVKCILRTERHRMHVVKHFWFFKKDLVLCSSFLSFCIYVDFFWSFSLTYHSGHWQFCLLDLDIFSVSMWLIVQEGFSVFSGHENLRFIFMIIFILLYFDFTEIIIKTEDSCDVRVSFVTNIE
jgi:hypothetical protein